MNLSEQDESCDGIYYSLEYKESDLNVNYDTLKK